MVIMNIIATYLLLQLLLGLVTDAAFVTNVLREETISRKDSSTLLFAKNDNIDQNDNALDVVLFGVGDLRVDDHEGLFNAISSSNEGNSKVLPLFVLTKEMIQNMPGAVSHTIDTANQITSALKDLDGALKESTGLNLHTVFAMEDDSLEDVVIKYTGTDNIRLHVCDLGPADNDLGYGPYGQLTKNSNTLTLVPWSNSLRDAPWENVKGLPEFYPKYEQKYCSNQPKIPITINDSLDESRVTNIEAQSLPSAEDMQEKFMKANNLDPDVCKAEKKSGLYATHWGGMKADTVGCREVLKILTTYSKECNEDGKLFSQNPSYTLRKCERNGRSLEHAAMIWQLIGDGSSPAGNTDNWLAGEAMNRFLAAPLFLGTISPRRVWYAGRDNYVLFSSPLRQLVEGREWHRLLAARNIENDPAYQGQGNTVYKYWRYHGFLCRYAETNFENPENSNEGIMLVHGFGASGAQWNKAMQELASCSTFKQGLAPDQLGFGQAEKPAISYTGYMWTAQMMDFLKEIALYKNGWESYVTGGNSIGGFASMSLAACDRAVDDTVSSAGARGTGRCNGLVLMNSAGPVFTKDEVEAKLQSARDLQLESVAQVTALEGLPPCKPPARPFARAFGNVLLGYLRPRIQSICKNLYPTNPSAVDDILCKGIERDSLDPGAINVMISGAKLPPPRTANELLAADFGSAHPTEGQIKESSYDGPVLIAQGVLDPLNDSKDRMNRFGSLRNDIVMSPIEAGHCPHDEQPESVAKSIASWMTTRTIRKTSSLKTMSSVQ